jgi:hypothetical protein
VRDKGKIAMHTLKYLSGVVVILLLALACAPTTFTQTRLQWRPYNEAEYKQAKDGIIIEMRDVRQLPEAFFATVPACDRAGRLLINQYGNPVTERVSLAAPGQFWEQVAITNQTDHIVRLNTVAIRLFDPSGNQLEPLTKEDLESAFLSRRPCPSSQQAARQIRAIKLIDRNMEIVPNSTASGWIAFAPPSMQMPGVWKFAFYADFSDASFQRVFMHISRPYPMKTLHSQEVRTSLSSSVGIGSAGDSFAWHFGDGSHTMASRSPAAEGKNFCQHGRRPLLPLHLRQRSLRLG